MGYRIKRTIAAIFFCGIVAVSGSLKAQDWDYSFEPYGHFASIDGDVGIGRVSGVAVDIDFSDVLDVLEFGFMAHFEGHHRSGWGFALDYNFIDLGDDLSGPRGGVISTDVEQTVFEALAVKRMRRGSAQLDYLAGFRIWDNTVTAVVDPAVLPGSTNFSGGESWFDLVVGVRWSAPVSDRVRLTLRGDIGGLGLESDFTSTLMGGVHVSLSPSIYLDLQYKSTLVDFESGDTGESGYFKYDTVTHGPLLGLAFKF